MANTNRTWTYIFLGFALLTVACGLYLAVTGDYLIGTSGACVGAFLAWKNWPAKTS